MSTLGNPRPDAAMPSSGSTWGQVGGQRADHWGTIDRPGGVTGRSLGDIGRVDPSAGRAAGLGSGRAAFEARRSGYLNQSPAAPRPGGLGGRSGGAGQLGVTGPERRAGLRPMDG